VGGYEVPSSSLHLSFDKYPGLEVEAGSIALGRLLDLTEGAESLRSGDAASDSATALFAEFGEALRSWNCERDGQPIPADLTGLRSLEAGFGADILLAWFDAINGVSGPLERTSNGGAQSAAPLIQTEAL
jgi:hypothetical protein